MSLLKKIGGVFKKALPLASFIPGPIGMAAGAISAARGAMQAARPSPVASMAAFPSVGTMIGGGARVIPGLGSVGRGVARVGGAVVGSARNLYRSAASYCRKHPSWCQTVGGIAAVEAMISRGELPPVKRRRGRGISATELKNFKRVAKFTGKYCAPVRKALKAPALRGKSCR